MTDQARAAAISEQARKLVRQICAGQLQGNKKDWRWLFDLTGAESEQLIVAALTAAAETARAQYDELHRTTEGLLEAANIRIRQIETALEAAQGRLEETQRESFKAGFLALITNRDGAGEPLRPSFWTFESFSVAHDLEPEAYAAWLRFRAAKQEGA